MLLSRLLVLLAFPVALAFSEDFSLNFNDIGPISVHTVLTFEGSGERLIANAVNESGQPIPYIRLCVTAAIKGCLFELWNTKQWEPDTELTWNVASPRRVANLAHEVKITALNALKTPQVKSNVPPSPEEPNRVLSQETIPAEPKPVAVAGPPSQVRASFTQTGNPPRSQFLQLHDGTPVRLRLNRNLSSADSRVGESVDFEVLEDIKVEGTVLIARGSMAIATVTQAQPKRSMGRTGKLDVNIDSVRLVNGEKVALRAVKEARGGGHTGAMTGGMVATAIVFFPAAPLFLFMHGKDITIPKGTEITAYVNGEVTLGADQLVAPAPPPLATPLALPSPLQQEALRPPGKAMTNYDVIVLKTAGLSDELIISKIKASPTDYKMDTEDLIALKKAGISDTVMQAMLEAQSRR